MAKKKSEDGNAGGTPMAAQADLPTALDDELDYWVGEWNGLMRWQCGQCPWDTLDGEEAMLRHIADRHAPLPAPARAQKIQVYDRWGNPV